MRDLRKLALPLLGTVALGLSAVSCSGSGELRLQQPDPALSSGLPATPAEALAQLDALPTPPGADPAVFAELKSGLRAMLEQLPPGQRLVAKAPTGPGNVISDLTSGVDDLGNEGIQWNYLNQGDYNFDGIVSVQDLSQIGINFNKDEDSPDWKNQARFADGNGDGRVSINDLTPIGANFLSQVGGYRIESGPGPDGPFTEQSQTGFDTGTPMLTGIRMFHFTPPVPAESWRVVPLDPEGNPGEPSLPSTDFKISEKTRIVGQPGGPQYVSHDIDRVVLMLPEGVENPVSPGDIIVGKEQGGYLMKAMDISQTGNEVEVMTEPAILSDVFLQGGLSEGLTDISQVPPAVYTLTLDGQTLCETAELNATIESGSVTFLPAADVAVNYNEFGGVTYLRGLAQGGPLDFKCTTVFSASEWSGVFPPTPADVPFFEHKLTGFTFDFIAYQNNVPVTMALQYDVYVGVKGEGDFFGTYVASCDSSYGALKMGGIADSTGITHFNEYTPTQTDPGAPFVDGGGQSFSITTYVRPEIHIRLYGNPIAGNTEDLALTLSPQFTFAGVQAVGPTTGFDYTITGGLENSFLLVLHHIGLDDQPQSRLFEAVPQLIRSGFVPDFNPPG
ncbi:hypothetical protein IT575_00840 [bacterium]|nr:hypothetical protein [bacterium]